VIAIPLFSKNINIPFLNNDVEVNPIENEDEKFEYELNDEGIIKSEHAKKIIEKKANEVMLAIKNKDANTVSEYVHPVNGVRFTPYTSVSLEGDIVFSKEKMANFFEDENVYAWGYYDGIGDEIKLTPSQYYEKFIYTLDFINADELGYNEVLSYGNAVENQFEAFDNPIVVEYYFPSINPEYDGLDWQSLRLVFEEYEGSWMLVGIIHNQWTI
jgi:hypothetical protein